MFLSIYILMLLALESTLQKLLSKIISIKFYEPQLTFNA